MRKLLLTIFISTSIGVLGQENPFEKYGYKPTIATLSNGKFNEFHDRDTIVQIGHIWYNTLSKKIIGFVDIDSARSEEVLEADLVSRWISPDPLAHEFPSWSPYAGFKANPVRFIDPDGRAAVVHDWEPVVNEDGGTDYIAEEGDNGITFKEQFGLSTKEAAQILVKNGFDKSAVRHIDEGKRISGEIVKSVTGSEVLALNMSSSSLTNADINRQLAFAINKTNADGNAVGNINTFFSNWKEYSLERAQGYQHGITTDHNYPTRVNIGGENVRISSSIGTHHDGLFLSSPSPDRQLYNGRRASDYFHPNSLERSGASIPAFTIWKH